MPHKKVTESGGRSPSVVSGELAATRWGVRGGERDRPPKKIRADQLLVTQGLAGSRHQARGLILSGRVFSQQGRVEKAGELLKGDESLTLTESPKFVSRGGIKLDHALKAFSVDPSGQTCLDVGASTGGFTDCLLQRGAKKVFAIDVGYGQLDWQLRQDSRIVLLERANFRYLDPTKIADQIDLAVVDVSFISLTKILPKLKQVLRRNGEAVVLVKPQFELSPAEAKKGVVRSEELREKAVTKIEAEARRLGFKLEGKTPSPILGPKGNQEYFLHLLTR